MEFFGFLKKPFLPTKDITRVAPNPANGKSPLLERVRKEYDDRTFGNTFKEVEERFIGGGKPMSGGRGPVRKFAGEKDSNVYEFKIPVSRSLQDENVPFKKAA